MTHELLSKANAISSELDKINDRIMKLSRLYKKREDLSPEDIEFLFATASVGMEYIKNSLTKNFKNL